MGVRVAGGPVGFREAVTHGKESSRSIGTARSSYLADRRHLIPSHGNRGKTAPYGRHVGLWTVHGTGL